MGVVRVVGTSAPALRLRDGDRELLTDVVMAGESSRTTIRAQIVLMAADGLPTSAIAAQLGVSRPMVMTWRERYDADGVDALVPAATDARRTELIMSMLEPPPADLGVTRWSSRLLAGHHGVSHVTVTRAWRDLRLRPTAAGRYAFDLDPPLTDRCCGILGVYVSAVECAVVLDVGDPGRDPLATAARSGAGNGPAAVIDTSPATRIRGALARYATGGGGPEAGIEGGSLADFLGAVAAERPGAPARLVVDNKASALRSEVTRWASEHAVTIHQAADTAAWFVLLHVVLTLTSLTSRHDPVPVSDRMMWRLRALAARARVPFMWVGRAPATAAPARRQRSAVRSGRVGLPDARHGFPFLVQAGHTKFPPGTTVRYPRVQSRAVVGCHAGRGWVALCGARPRPLQPGMLYLLPWNHSIEYRSDPRDPFFVYGLHVIPWHRSDEPLRFSAAHDPHDQYADVEWRRPCPPGMAAPPDVVVATSESERPGLAALTRFAVERFGRGLPSAAEARALGVLALAELDAPSAPRPEEDPTLPASLRGLLVWITRDLGRPMRLRDLAAVAECSPSTVTRLFRRYLDTAPMDWVIERRIEQAQLLLAAENATIASVARRCGYDDPDYFARLFKNRVGATPREWRHFRSI